MHDKQGKSDLEKNGKKFSANKCGIQTIKNSNKRKKK